MRQKRRGRLRGYPDKTRANPSGTGADPEKSSTVKTRHGLFRLAHMDDGHENGQASVLFLFSPPHRKAFHVSINRSGGSPLSSHHLQRQRDLLRVDVRPRFVCPGIGRAEAANSLIDAFIMRMGLAWLLAASLGCGFIGIYAAQAAAPVPPALIGFAYLRLWARRNSPVHQ